jgi:hypothetical protein
MRWACPKFVRQSFHEWAGCSIQFCGWAKAYYDQQRFRNESHHTAIRALAFKWIRILSFRSSVVFRQARLCFPEKLVVFRHPDDT